jgi:hypothetical protein
MPKPILKSYTYDGDAGVVLLDFEEFMVGHIQDEAAALRSAERLLRVGEDVNIDEHEGVREVYSLNDRAELVTQLCDAFVTGPAFAAGASFELVALLAASRQGAEPGPQVEPASLLVSEITKTWDRAENEGLDFDELVEQARKQR